MKILIVRTNRELLNKAGSSHRITQLTDMLSSNFELVYLNPRLRDCEHTKKKEYYFEEYFLFGKSLAMFVDLNLGYIRRLKQIYELDDISLTQISFPWGVVAASFVSKKSPIVYDAIGVEKDFAKVSTKSLPKIMGLVVENYIRFIEWLACKRSSHIITISEVDRDRLVKLYSINCSKISVIPTGFYKKLPLSDDAKKYIRLRYGINAGMIVIVFHGSYTHPPNREAFDLILNYIAPKFETNKNVIFVLAGTGLDPFVKNNIKSVGYVEDIFELLQIADIAIVPIREGSGVRMKIIDYLTAGLPIISTRKGAEGINLENNTHAIIVDDINEKFIKCIEYLCNDFNERRRLSENCRQLALNEYGWDNISRKINTLYFMLTR